MANKNSKSLYIVALALFLGGIGYLLFSGFSQNSVYFLNVSEALAMPSQELNSVRMFGTVAPQEIITAEDGLGVSFILEDKEDSQKTMRVTYKGVVPDTFKVGAEVIVEGVLASNNEFTARTLMTKCPSKYQKENRE